MAEFGNNASTNPNLYGHTDDTVITMQRDAPAKSPDPVYSLKISGNGSVVYNGIRNVKILGKQTAQISKAGVNELVNDFVNIYYFALKDKYGDPKLLEQQTITTSIYMDGRNKTISHQIGASGAPKGLSTLEDKIDKITNSKQWTGL